MQGPQRFVIAHGHVKQQLQVLDRVFGRVQNLGQSPKNKYHLYGLKQDWNRLKSYWNYKWTTSTSTRRPCNQLGHGLSNWKWRLWTFHTWVTEVKLGILKLQLQTKLTWVFHGLSIREEPFGLMKYVRTSKPDKSTTAHQGIRCAVALTKRTVSNVKLSRIELFCTCSYLHCLLIVLVDQCIAWRNICWNDSDCGFWIIWSLASSFSITRLGPEYPNLDGNGYSGYSEAAGFKHRLTLRERSDEFLRVVLQSGVFCQHLLMFGGWNPFFLDITSSWSAECLAPDSCHSCQ